MTVYETRSPVAQCPSCGSTAFVKGTKTHHMMLRCNSCEVLIFANGPASKNWLESLPS